MNSNLVNIMKKEASRIFNDRRLFFSVVILPGILIFAMYTFMGRFLADMFTADDDYVFQVHTVYMPENIRSQLLNSGVDMDIHTISSQDIPGIKQQIEDRETDLLVIFPIDFTEQMQAFDTAAAAEAGVLAPNIEVWSNAARPESSDINHAVVGMLNAYHFALTHVFSVNAPTEAVPDGNFNLATEADMFGMVIGFIVPLMFLMFIFSGCQGIAPESIAGQKEKGTLGGLLVTPASRTQMALGMILSLSVFALLSAIGSLLGALLSMPAMMGLDGVGFMDVYTIGDIALLFLVAGSTTLIYVAVLSVFSAYAKSVKEANTYTMPFMLLNMVCGLASTLLGRVPSEVHFYFIPIFNSSLSISSVFSNEVNPLNMIVTTGTNLIVAAIFAFVLAKLFNSEKIVFDK